MARRHRTPCLHAEQPLTCPPASAPAWIAGLNYRKPRSSKPRGQHTTWITARDEADAAQAARVAPPLSIRHAARPGTGLSPKEAAVRVKRAAAEKRVSARLSRVPLTQTLSHLPTPAVTRLAHHSGNRSVCALHQQRH